MDIGKRIKQLREDKDLTQKELADKVQLNYSVLSRIESGERRARDEELIKIAKELDVTVDYILGLPSENKGKADLTEDEIITLAAHQLGHEGKLSEYDKEKIRLAIQLALMKNDKR